MNQHKNLGGRMKDMEIFRQEDAESAAADAGENLNQILIENKNKPTLLMLSAGSSLSILNYVGPMSVGENLTISVLDERFSQDPAINNFEQLQKTDFYTDAFNAESSFFGTLPRDREKIQDLAKRWENNLVNWRKENPTGLIVATLGMAADGHTAGIFPFPESPDEFHQLFEGDSLVTAYNVGDKHQYQERVTTTLTFFDLIDVGLAYVVGAEKKEKLDAVIKKQGQVYKLPALAWDQIKKVKIFTDTKE